MQKKVMINGAAGRIGRAVTYEIMKARKLGEGMLEPAVLNDIVGIEIEHASEFLNNLDISKEFLKNLEGAKMIIDKRNNNCQIVFIVLELHARRAETHENH